MWRISQINSTRSARWFLTRGSPDKFKLAIACCVVLGVQYSAAPSVQAGNGDILWLFAPDPPTANDVHTGHPMPIKLSMKYVLASADYARLQVFVEEFPQSAGGCDGSVHKTNGGGYFPIQRGTVERPISITWRGDAPVYPRGYFTVGANLSTADGKTSLGSFNLFTGICYRFSPAGGGFRL